MIPVGDRVIVERDEKSALTKGGLILPDNAREVSYRGTVLFVGPGRWLENGERAKPQVAAGDKVIFGNYVGEHAEIEHEGKKIIGMHEGDILCVVEE